MRRLLLLAFLPFTPGPSGAALAVAALPPVDPVATASQSLFVEIVLNGRPAGDVVPMTLSAGEDIISRADLRAAGLLIDGDGAVDVSRLHGVTAHYDAPDQLLRIDASPDMLPTNHLSPEGRERTPTVANFGAMLNYDAYAQRSGDVTTASLWTEQRLFGPLGTLSNDGTLRISHGGGPDMPHGYLRYDTRYRYVDEDHALAFTAGDLITQSLPWTTSVRLGGFQIARDYRVRPDLLTMPMPSFAGKTAVPSAVDLFVDGYRQQGTNVAPGRFVLDNIPVVNGAGEATIITTDAVGRQIATTIPFYVSSELLKPGLLDIAGEVGFLRRDYGLRSFRYGALAASGTVRRGINRRVTLEAHGEATHGLALGGLGVVWAPGLVGTLNLSAAVSHVGGRSAGQWSIGYNYTSRRFTIGLEHDQRDAAYRDLGSFDLAQYVGTRRSDRMVASLNLARQGSVGFAFVNARTLSGPRTRIASLSYSRPLGRRASLFLSADHDFGQRSSSVQLRLILPFGHESVSAGLSHDRSRGTLGEIDYARTVPTQGGFGANADIASDDQGRAYGQATLTWRGQATELQVGGAFAQGRESQWAGATGSIVAMDGGLFAANEVSDAFAVVSTGGAQGIPVSYENQPMGVTDRHGHLFVPEIAAYHPGRFSIDTLGMPADRVAAAVEERVALREGSGALIRMPVRRVHNAMVTLVDSRGQPLAPGGRVSRAGAPDAEIGWDGIVYLDDIAGRSLLSVTGRDGHRCHAEVTLPHDARPLAQIGPVTCR